MAFPLDMLERTKLFFLMDKRWFLYFCNYGYQHNTVKTTYKTKQKKKKTHTHTHNNNNNNKNKNENKTKNQQQQQQQTTAELFQVHIATVEAFMYCIFSIFSE